MKAIGIGIVGYGFIGKVHAYSCINLPMFYDNLPFKAKIVGICDTSQAMLDKARSEVACAVYTNDYKQLLAREDIHVINCCTPNIFHKELLLDAAKSGKHIYCDKPMTVTLKEAQEVVAAVNDAGVLNQMTMEYRFIPAIIRARQLIDDGFLGDVFNFRITYLHSGYIDPKRPLSWRMDKAISGGGALLDMGPHPIDTIRYLLGDFDRVFAITRTYIKERPSLEDPSKIRKVDVDDVAVMQVEMKNGCMGYLEVSRLSTGMNDDLRFEIHGSKGALAFGSMDQNWLLAYDCRDPENPIGGMRGFKKIETVQRYPAPCSFPGPKFSIGWIRTHVASLYDFLTHVSDGTPTHLTFEDGLQIQKVICAGYESAETNQWKTV